MIGTIKRIILKFTVCLVWGHESKGIFLWWVCDRCFTDFMTTAKPSQYIGGTKVTRSK